MVAWEKGKVLHQLYQKLKGRHAQPDLKEQYLAACRLETQQAIALFVKQHPKAGAAAVPGTIGWVHVPAAVLDAHGHFNTAAYEEDPGRVTLTSAMHA